MNVMTYLVGILGGVKSYTRLIIPAIICCTIYLCLIPIAFAELSFPGLPSAPDPTPGTNPNLSFPTNPPDRGAVVPPGTTTGTPLNPDDPNLLPPPPVVPTIAPLGGTNDPILLVLHAIVTAVGWIAGQFGYMFDYAISNYIVGFGDKYINYNIGDVIDNLWSTVRDIFNLTFIFGLVYIGFKMILDSADSSARKMLVSLIGAALLVNFSLFITKFVVDFSNIAAYQIYKAFAGSSTDGSFSLTRAFMNQMEIDSLFSVPYVDGYQYILGLLIVFLVLAYVFLAGAIMIIIRFVVLNIYMVFSPLMFLGWVFPAMKGYSTKYWSGFLSQAFFAPAFLFMLYLSYRVADSYKYTGKDFNLIFNPQSSTFGGNATSVNEIIPYFAMVIVFLVASIVVAKKMGGTSASLGIAMTNKIRGGAQGVLAGGAGKFGKNKLDSWSTREDAPIRRGLARGATLLGVRDYADKQYKSSPQGKWAETRKKRTGELATRQAQTSLNQAISRGVTAVAGSQEQINFERAIQGANQSQLVESLREQGQGSEGYNRIVRAMSGEQVRDLLKAKDDVFSPNEQRDLSVASGSQAAVRLQAALTPGGPARTLAATVPRASVDDLFALSKVPDPNNPNTNLLSANAQHISAARMDDLRSKLAPTELSNLNTARNNQLLATFTANPAAVFNNRSDVEIARLPREILTARTPAGVLIAENYLNINALRLMMQGNNNGDYVLPHDRRTIKTALENTPNTTLELTRIVDWLATPQGQAF